MDLADLKRHDEERDEFNDFVECRWSEYMGWGYGHFISWSIQGDDMCIKKQRPRNGGIGIDRIPLSEFLK